MMSSNRPSSSDPKKHKQQVKSKGQVGEWVRHISSSGKEYYFNMTTHASQWEKPREWLEHEKKHGPVSYETSSASSSQGKAQHHQQQKPASSTIGSDRDQHHGSVTYSSISHHSTTQRDSSNRQLQHLAPHGNSGKDALQQARERHYYHHYQQGSSLSSQSHTSSGITIASTSASFSHSHQATTSSTTFVHPSHSTPFTSSSTNSHYPSMHPSSSSTPFYQSIKQETGHHVVSSSSSANLGVSSTDLIASQKHFSEFQRPSTSTASSSKEARKSAEDLQTEDMDISPIYDDESPGPSTKFTGTSSNNGAGISSYTRQAESVSGSSCYSRSAESISGSSSYSRPLESVSGSNSYTRSTELPFSSYQVTHSSHHRNYGSSSIASTSGNNGYDRIRDRDRRNRSRERIDRRDVDRRDRSRERERDRRNRSRERDRRENDRRDRSRERQDRRDIDNRDRDRGRTRERDKERNDRDREGREIRERSRSNLRDERRSESPGGTPERSFSEDSTGTGSGGVGSLSALNQPDTEIPPLPASLAAFYREDLIQHVKNLPGDIFERQANKLSEELLTNYAFQLSKVSADLKMARSLVRLTEIQSTLMEQRILFIRQQMKVLEDGENSSLLGVETSEAN